MKKIIGIASIVIVGIILVAIGSATKKSFVMNEEGDMREYSFFEMVANKIYYYQVEDVDKFFEDTPIILKVKKGEDKKYLNQCILSDVKIEEIYKNSKNIDLSKGEDIYIYEPIFVQHSDKSIYTANSYIPMKDKNEYIVFLKELKVPEGYKMSEKERVTFMYMNPLYGKRGIEKLEYILKSDSNKFKLKDLDKYNAILNKEEVEKYTRYNQKVDEIIK